MKISFMQRVEEGYMVPRFYGVAYIDHMRAYAVCYPIPFNKIVGWSKMLRDWLRSPPRLTCHQCRRKEMLSVGIRKPMIGENYDEN